MLYNAGDADKAELVFWGWDTGHTMSDLIKEKINKIKGAEDRDKLIDYTKFQIEDIEKGKLKIGEEEELKEEYNVLNNAEKINNALRISYGLLSQREDGNSILESLSKVISEVSSVENHLEALKEKRELLEGAYFSLEEATRDIRDLGDEIVYDDVRLGKINERIYEINTPSVDPRTLRTVCASISSGPRRFMRNK